MVCPAFVLSYRLYPFFHCATGLNAQGPFTVQAYGGFVTSRLLRHKIFIPLRDNLTPSLDSPLAPIGVWAMTGFAFSRLLSLLASPLLCILERKTKGKPFLCTFCPSCQFSLLSDAMLPKGTSLGRTDFAPGRLGILKKLAVVGAGRMCVFFFLYLTPALLTLLPP